MLRPSPTNFPADDASKLRPSMSDWLFGYGSLIWRPGFPPEAEVYGEVFGFRRRFYQGSPDHRGTDAQPGRVVTLLPGGDDEKVFGVALKIPPKQRATILDVLEEREQAGYERLTVSVCPRDGRSPIEAFTFVATEDNPSFLGAAPLPQMAAQIATARGQSGPNRDYLLRLQQTLQQHRVSDPHVDTLVDALADHDATVGS